MIIVQITGGLGNQMFQYAAGKALSLHHKVPLKLDLQQYRKDKHHELEIPRQFELTAFEHFEYTEATVAEIEHFTIQNNLTRRIQKILPVHKRKIYTEKAYPFDPHFFKANKDIYLKGHRQTSKYFERFSNNIRSIYQLKPELTSNVENIKKNLSNKNTVAVHVRRGDYLRLPIILDWHGVLSEQYYFNALEYLSERINDLQVFYFSDDPEWIRDTLIPKFPGTIVSDSITKTNYQDFYLIQSCKHQVVANSSFSWWAAWLNPNPDKIVIAPKKWFNNAPYDTRDLIPESWIKM